MAIRVTYSTATDAAYIFLVPIGPGEAARTWTLALTGT
jgi:hypothetical protein